MLLGVFTNNRRAREKKIFNNFHTMFYEKINTNNGSNRGWYVFKKFRNP